MRFSAFFASHISRISGSSSTRRTVGQLWGPSAPGTHNPQGSPGRNGHIGVATLLLTNNKATPGDQRVAARCRWCVRMRQDAPGGARFARPASKGRPWSSFSNQRRELSAFDAELPGERITTILLDAGPHRLAA